MALPALIAAKTVWMASDSPVHAGSAPDGHLGLEDQGFLLTLGLQNLGLLLGGGGQNGSLLGTSAFLIWAHARPRPSESSRASCAPP